jgi:hypothetical protein
MKGRTLPAMTARILGSVLVLLVVVVARVHDDERGRAVITVGGARETTNQQDGSVTISSFL